MTARIRLLYRERNALNAATLNVAPLKLQGFARFSGADGPLAQVYEGMLADATPKRMAGTFSDFNNAAEYNWDASK